MAGQGYDRNDFISMQREAERRVMDMQRRAKTAVEQQKEEKAPPAPPPPVQSKGNNLLSMLNLKSFFENKDTSLVLMVLALVNAEDTDPLLMLALLYVMM